MLVGALLSPAPNAKEASTGSHVWDEAIALSAAMLSTVSPPQLASPKESCRLPGTIHPALHTLHHKSSHSAA